MTTPNPNPNDPFGSASTGGAGGTRDPLGSAPNSGAPSTDAVPEILGAIPKMILGGLGIKAGLIDQLLNTVFYSICAIAGIGAMVYGLNLIVKEIPGASGVGGILSGFAGGIGGKVADVVAPEVAIPAQAAGKVMGWQGKMSHTQAKISGSP